MLKLTRTQGLQALAAAVPIWIGYVAVGLPFGVLAAKQGLTPGLIALMSLIVFAGSAQFIAVGLIGADAGLFTIIFTTFFVNLRHLLMSSALALHLKGRSKGFLSAFAYGVTDESFAVNLTRFGRGAWTPEQALIVNQTSNLVWFVSTVAGGYLGDVIPAGACGIDYALTAMFLGLLVLQVRDWLLAAVALLAGLIAVGLKLLGPGNWQVIAATVIAAAVGLVVTERWPKLARGQR